MPPKRACDVCFKRKIQCTIANSDAPCEWCSHHQLDCTFNRESQKNPRNTKALAGDVEELFRRIESLENALARHNAQHQSHAEVSFNSSGSTTSVTEPAESSQDATPLSLGGQSLSEAFQSPQASPLAAIDPQPGTSVSQPRQLRDVARYLGQNWYHKGIPILSERGNQWIRSKTGTENAICNFNLIGSAQSSPRASVAQLSHQELYELPDRSLAHQILGAVRPSLRVLYLVLDRPLFEETIITAYELPEAIPSTCDKVSAKACVLAALALASRLKGLEDCSHPLDGEVCASKALRLLGEVSYRGTLVNLQTTLMLQLYQTFTGRWEEAIALHSAACRLVCGLEGHFYQHATPYSATGAHGDRETGHIRMLFWLSYMFDKDISLRSGQPPLLTEDYCDLTLPGPSVNSQENFISLDENLETGDSSHEELVLYIRDDLGLSYIKEKACRLLYSPKAFSLDDSQLLQHVRQLDGELEDWRQSIPLEFRPKLSLTPNCITAPSQMSPFQRMYWTSLQLEYHYVVTAIHTMVKRCGAVYAEAGDLPHDLHMVFHSSHNLSLEASRSTLLLLKNPTMEMLEDQGLWRILFYSEVAAVSLFMNILIHPLDQQAHQDLGVLSSAVGMFHNISARDVTNDEMDYIQEMSNFVAELARLGNCAIWKARREQRDGMAETPQAQ